MSVFNQPIGDWDTSSVTKTTGMFKNATAFNQPIGDWDTSSVTHMNNMFENATAFNQPIDNWDVGYGHVRNVLGASAFNQPMNVSSVTNTMSHHGASSFGKLEHFFGHAFQKTTFNLSATGILLLLQA